MSTEAGGRFAKLSTAMVALVLTVLAALGCSASDESASPGQRRQTAGPEAGTGELEGQPTSLQPGAGLLLGTPIHGGDFADPYVLAAGDAFYAYSTNTTDANVPVMVVRNSPTARYVGDALPQLPQWSEPGFVWAPAVLALDDRYVLYYSTRLAGTSTQCISSAVAEDPVGPFVDDSSEPLVCQKDLGGSIDPSILTDRSGRHWLLFKNDGNCCAAPTSIWSQQLGADGRTLIGQPSELLTAEQGWEGELIEAPSMVVTDDGYVLFYSANAWDSKRYAIGVARCDSPSGPCERIQSDPWMASTLFAHGPGGQEFFEALGDVWMVYHGWESPDAAGPGGIRRLHVDVVDFDGDVPQRVGARNAGLLLAAVVTAILIAVLAIWYGVLRRRRPRPAVSK